MGATDFMTSPSGASEDRTPIRVYHNSVLRVRFLMGVSLVFLAAMGLLGVTALTRMEDEQTGALIPPGERIAFAGVCFLVALGFPVGMWIYGRRYVGRIEWTEGDDAIDVTTVGWLTSPRRRIPLERIEGAKRKHDTASYPVTVNNFWDGIRVRGERFPLIVDLTNGDVRDGRAYQALARGEVPPPAPRPREPRPARPNDPRAKKLWKRKGRRGK